MNIAIIVFVAIIQSILFLGHYLLYRTLLRFYPFANTYLSATKIVFFLLSISFIITSVIAFKFYGPVTRTFYSAAVIWLGTFYWLLIASIISWFIYSFSPYGKNLTPLVSILFVLAILTSGYGIWNSYQTKIRTVTIKLENLPEEWKGKRAVLVADTHLGNVRNLKFGKKIANLIQQQNPDIVFIAGDFYDGTPTDYQVLAEPFGQIQSKYGTYFAPGNHEEFGNKSPFLNGLRSAGVKVLDNQKIEIDGVQLIGLDYVTNTKPADQIRNLANLNIDKNVPSIVIKHVPSLVDLSESAGIDLQLSGHTHLGQVFPMQYVTKAIFGQFYYGYSRLGNLQNFTTSGAGTWGPPQRVGTNSEIIVITFE
ncbi:MAG: metallophosphoesterase [Candidatus Doudnabacteria bacterium]|nr:metallophosphoesterase [Candidatus Doudnabacteria bacterium]